MEGQLISCRPLEIVFEPISGRLQTETGKRMEMIDERKK